MKIIGKFKLTQTSFVDNQGESIVKKLAEFPSVLFFTKNSKRVDHPTKNWQTKFILAKVSDGQNEKIVFCSLEGWNYHSDVFLTLKAEAQKTGLTVSSAGGGMMVVETASNHIVIGGSSKSFGEFNTESACKLLQEALPDWSIEVEY